MRAVAPQGVDVAFDTAGKGALADAAARVADGRLRTPTIVTYPLDRAIEARSDYGSGRVRGKLVILV